ncbi:SdrD B-like domain-containing protein [Paenibacillus sp. YN15]|uniref:SdrD B-like domain-containing protein n=1 Tax=Paenibacillus sp. YN15 TaxID=1742774 RepID=UPI000DCC91FE|nr:SdrD B-like domain-containing protein [Paenibacillus sp. YN15]RAV06291.1 hypothetical protein DQG13_00075 [Paenibacillus sp. YN15]
MRLKRKTAKISRISIALMWVMLLQMLLQPFAGISFASTPIDGFTLTKEADKAEVEVGEEVVYTIRYQVDGSTAVGKTVQIKDVVPSQFEILEVPAGWSKSGQTVQRTQELGSGTTVADQIRVKAKPTGSASPVSTVNKVTATDQGDPSRVTEATASVTIKADPNPVSPSPSPNPTPVQDTYNKWETFKTQLTGLSNSSIPIVDGIVTYEVGIKGTAGNTGAGNLTNITLVDQLPANLPAGAEVTFPNDPPPSGSTRDYDPGSSTITWTIPSIGASQTFKDIIKVKFPDNYGYSFTTSNPESQINTVTLDTYSIDGKGIIGGSSSSVTTKFGPPVSGAPVLSKSRQYDYRYPGQTQTFTIKGISNVISNANSALTDLVLVDTLPPEMSYSKIRLPAGWSTFQYETSSGGGWKTATGLPTVGTARDLTVGGTGNNIVVNAGEYLTRVKWTFAKLNPGSTISDITVTGTVLANANGTGTQVKHGDTVTNSAYLDYKLRDTTNPGVIIPGEPLTAAASFKINEPKPWLTVDKTYDDTVRYGPLINVPFTLQIGNDLKATGPYENPVIYDVLPAEFDYYTNPKIADAAVALAQSFQLVNAPSGLSNPKIEIIPAAASPYPGRTIVKWYWDESEGVKLLPGQSFTIRYEGVVKAGTAQNSPGYTNDVYITTASQNKEFWYTDDPDWPANQDAAPDLDSWRTRHPGIHNSVLPSTDNNAYYVHDDVKIPIVKTALVQSTKWNRGDLEPIFRASDNPAYQGEPALPVIPFDSEGNPQYTEFPRYSVTFEGGTADYKLAIRNSGNTRIGKIDVLDILPYVGDSALRVSGTALTPRGSQWKPNLAEVLPSGAKTFTSSSATGSKTVEYQLTAYYSKSSDQDKVVNFTNATGGKSGWVAQTAHSSDNLTDIKSLYFAITGIKGSDGENGLAPGDYIVLDWKMDAPVGAPTGEIAWNSFAIQAQEINNGLKMLPTAPNKVGFIVDPNSVHVPLGEIGDFVWFDSDRDGLQNERFDGDPQKSGINGITVNLYKEAGNGQPEAAPFKSSKTGYDTSGNPGYYLFQGLEDGSYYVEFVLPEHYLPTIPDADGADDAQVNGNDSNFTTAKALSGGYTSYMTKRIVLPEAGKNRTIDFGLVEKQKPSGNPTATLDKKLERVELGSSTASTVSQDYAVSGNKVQYSIEFKNTSSVTLHNIKLMDQLDRNQAGFVFTKLIYNGEEIPLSLNSHGRPEIISGLDNDGTKAAPYVTVKELEPGKSIKLYGEYSVAAADVDGTHLKNTVEAFYNEATQRLTDDVEVPLAAIDVEKTGSALAVSQAGTVITYTVTVKNTGSYPLHHVVLTDSKASGLPPIAKLEPGEAKEITYTYTVTSADLTGAEIVNTVTAAPDETPRDTDSHTTPVDSTKLGSIGDYVWFDRNENGIQEAGEPGINGIVVKLYNWLTQEQIAEMATRDNNGKAGYYKFEGLGAGSYYVQFVIPADYGVTLPNIGAADTDSNATDSNGNTGKIVINSSNWHDPTIDLGLVPRGEIGNYVWLDSNHDGLQNDGDTPGINGIEVKLYKDSSAGEPLAVTTTRDGPDGKPGYYLFDNLLAGDYYVQFTIPGDYRKTVEEADSDRGQDSNPTNEQHITDKISIGEGHWVDPTIDLGLVPKGVIGNYVWFDLNRNGKQDEVAEYGRNGVSVKLYDENKQLLKETVTADDASGKPGYYLFDNLLGGKYYVHFTVPSGYVLTVAENAEAGAALDSNRLENGFTSVIAIGDADVWEDLTIDIGIRTEDSSGGGGYIPTPTPTPTPTATPTPTPGQSATPTPVPGQSASPAPSPSNSGNPGTNPGGSNEIPIENETTPKDTSKEGDVTVPDGGKADLGKQPENGKVQVDDKGKWTYTPNPGFTGQDSFSIVVKDEDGNEEEVLFEIDVEDVPLDTSEGGSPITGTLPKTGEENRLSWELTGFGLLCLGMFMRRRKRRL